MTARRAGRPTLYRHGFPEQAYKLSLLGATDAEIADFFGIDDSTLYRWKATHNEFRQAIKDGKRKADAEVAAKLYERAMGAEWTEQQAFKVKDGKDREKVVVVEVRRAAPPDTTACMYWLKNRQSERWRDRPAETADDSERADIREMYREEAEAFGRLSAGGSANGQRH